MCRVTRHLERADCRNEIEARESNATGSTLRGRMAQSMCFLPMGSL
jgi:hypothetical protein